MPIIIDGEIKENTLTLKGFSKEALVKALRTRGLTAEEVFVMTSDDENKFNIYLKEENNGS